MKFEPFPKIQRLRNTFATITEKIDGTNACLVFNGDGDMMTQSRNRIITPGKQNDNAGFSTWANENRERLFEFFGPGRHFGEWWGIGIQRGYNLVEKRFTPFNVHRFNIERDDWSANLAPLPVLWQGALADLTQAVDVHEVRLQRFGSEAAPGFMNPEGMMVYLTGIGYLKVPIDSNHKWQTETNAA